MKNPMIALMAIVMSSWLVGCSKNSSSTACGNAGYFADQSDCQSSGGGSCMSVTTQSDGKNVVCWKVGTTTSNSVGATPTPGSGTGCNGSSPPPWTVGPWVPAMCDGSAKKQTRTVTCDYNCKCSANKDITEQACEADLVNKKHYSGECEDAGGEVVPLNNGKNLVCQIPSSGCPSGWNTYASGSVAYTKTAMVQTKSRRGCGASGGYDYSHTGFHDILAATAQETKDYCSDVECSNKVRVFGGGVGYGNCKETKTAYATITAVACY